MSGNWFCAERSVSIATNGPRIGEGAEKKALTFNFAPT